MEKRILECVPNFSEGRNMNIIAEIADEIKSVIGVELLDIDAGKDANRTVVTFVGNPDAVIEAAFLAVKKAAQLIDMSKHHGAHPRIGATDVCPLIPVSGITMDEAVVYARKLAMRIGNELAIPVYCYENAAFVYERKNLANCRRGEYEGLAKKLLNARWKPDYGAAVFNKRSGATVVGARNFLVAYNVNLNTTSAELAHAIACDVREKGKTIEDANGKTTTIPGSLQAVKAIGWFIDEFGKAQVSMNLTDITTTPLHIAFEEVCRKAKAIGVEVTGSELVGLIPLEALLQAGQYFLHKQKQPVDVSADELINVAIKSLGLNDVKPFNPAEKIIDYVMSG